MTEKNLLKGFKRPSNVVFSTLESDDKYGKFEAAPFERGFGHSVGNSLRRALLSSIPGYAVSAIKITSFSEKGSGKVLDAGGNLVGPSVGISSEYEPIPYVVEDTAIVINNLKKLSLALPDDKEEMTITVGWKGKGVATGALLEKNGIIVTNKEQELFTAMPEADLEIDIQIDWGRGYVPSEVNQKYIDVVGVIPLDAFFSPVKRVRYTTEDHRVGNRNDNDKLILEVWTDGTLSPTDAVGRAAKILKEGLDPFINFDESLVVVDKGFDEEEVMVKALLATPVEELELSVRSNNCLKNASIFTLGDLVKKTDEEIARTKNFGKKSLMEIKDKLRERGLYLGLTDYAALKESIRARLELERQQKKSKGE